MTDALVSQNRGRDEGARAFDLSTWNGANRMNEITENLAGFLLSLGLLLPAGARAQTSANPQVPAERTVKVTLETGPKAAPDAIGETPSAPPAQASAGTVTLEELSRVALQKNPAIKGAWHRVQALKARIPQARSLPDPVVSAGWMGNIAPFDVQNGFPPSARMVSATQMIPFPGKLKLRSQMADREAEAAWWNYENTRRQVVAEVKTAYYDYFFYHQATEITRKDKDLLEKLAKIAEVRYKVGKGIQQDVLRAQVELSRLLQRLTVLEQEEKTAKVRLNTLLFQDPEAPLPPAAPFEQAQFPYSLEELYEMARQNDPGLQREERLIEKSQYAVNLAQKEYAPDLRLGYTYQQRPMLRDSQGFTIGVNIPIFYKSKQREGVIAATEEMISARRSHDDRQTMVSFQVKEQYLAAKAAAELARLYSQAVVPQSSLALESAMASYEVGKVDFLTMLTDFLTVLDYEINYYRELSNFQMALARLEPLVGRELTK
jgi:cobalt-zinc-cadmium efflux system outer membrane protein